MKKVAILATDGFEEVELTIPRKAIEDAGHTCDIIAPTKASIKAWDSDHWSNEYEVEESLDIAVPEDYDMLLLPGGVINPDSLRRNEKALKFVTSFFEKNKPVASICHGPQTMIDAQVVEGREMTSFSAIKQDLINAGAHWKDQEVIVDGNLITSRSPDDLEAFNQKVVETLKM